MLLPPDEGGISPTPAAQPDPENKMRALNDRQFGQLPGRYANGSAYGTDHPIDKALGKARTFKTHARAAKSQKPAPIWEPTPANMGNSMSQGGTNG